MGTIHATSTKTAAYPAREPPHAAERAATKSANGATARGDLLSIAAEDGDVALLKAQLDVAQGEVAAAVGQLKSNVSDIRRNTKERIRKVRQRVKAERSAKRWGALGKLFRAIAAVASTVSSIFTGAAGIAAAALLVVSMVVAKAAKNTVGKIVSAVLAVAGAIVSLGAGAANAASSIVKALTKAAELTSSGAGLVSGVASLGEGVRQKQNLDGQARLADLRRLMTRLQSSNQEELEDLRKSLDKQGKSVEQTGALLDKKHQAAIPSR